jgi:tetratricopeptide (TPR) repeat protein
VAVLVDHDTSEMFSDLHRWVLRLRDLGEVAGAQSAAEALCREARTPWEHEQAYDLLADLYVLGGDLAGARRVREGVVYAARTALAADPTSERKLALLSALDQLGDVARRQGDHRGVLECYGNAGRMSVLRDLARAHGDRAELLTEQCYSLRRAGTAARELGALEEARDLLEERVTVARLTFACDPADRRLLALVASAVGDLGSLLARLGDGRAGVLLREGLYLHEWLQTTEPDDVVARQELAKSHLAMTTMGADTAEHVRVATTLLTQIEAEGHLDVTGRVMLSGLRNR